MANGIYIILEGMDCAGKTTTLHSVAKRLAALGRKVICTAHPGATPLGRVLRSLNKNPELFDEAIKIDTLSEQLLMVVDHCCFVNTMLKPALDEGTIVLADRSNLISAIAYGLAGGLLPTEIDRMQRIVDTPMADRMFVMQISWDQAKSRLESRDSGADRFDDKEDDFHHLVQHTYDNIVANNDPATMILVNHAVPIGNIRYVDAMQTTEILTNTIMRDIEPLIE